MSKFFNNLKNIIFILAISAGVLPILIKFSKEQFETLLNQKTKIGVIAIKSALYEGDKYIKILKEYFKDKSIKAILLKIDCPGGAAGTSQAIFSEIKKLKAKYCKYVVVFVENMAASGGYYIATAGDYIISTPAAFIGSIGSYIAHPMFKDFIEQFKIKYEVIKTGDYKTVGNPFLQNTENQKQMLQELSDNVYRQFVSDVAAQRPNLSKDFKQWADGKIFTGEQAHNLGLIDQIGSESDIDNIFEQNAKLKGPFHWVSSKKRVGILRMLLNPDDDSEASFTSQFFSKAFEYIQKESLNVKY